MFDVDWHALFAFTVAPAELFIRGSLTYFFLFCLFRFVVRRDMGALGISDLLVLVIIADASQNAMAGGYESISDGFLLIATIIGWSYTFNFLGYRYAFFRKFALPRPLCIVKDGIKQQKNLKRELISDEELAEMLREHEIEDISEVRQAMLEPDGQLTVVRRRGGRGARGPVDKPAGP
ncbi:DUF421 domain-containing protein [Massilia sp. UMI-21]|nr:DUF421 domain-containing protein [Massilia sp. UMI-21]